MYENGSYVPCGKIADGQHYSIISDYIGRPIQVYNEQGFKVWSTDYDIYGRLRNLERDSEFIPFRQLGQYEDVELEGLYYNRFRYYDSGSGLYISKDPIGLAGNNPTMYAYVWDSNGQVDVFGLYEVLKLGLIYRSGSSTINSLTPALKDVPGGLSTFDNTTTMMKKLPTTTKAQVIDISKLGKNLEAVLDGTDGHVSIRPKDDTDGSKLVAWANLKGKNDLPNSLGEEVKQAVVREWKPEYK